MSAPQGTPHRPACATSQDIIAQTLIRHWSFPTVIDGNVVWVGCGAEDCGFRSSNVALMGEEGAWSEHAYHVAELLEQAGITETTGEVTAERLQLGDNADEEVAEDIAFKPFDVVLYDREESTELYFLPGSLADKPRDNWMHLVVGHAIPRTLTIPELSAMYWHVRCSQTVGEGVHYDADGNMVDEAAVLERFASLPAIG